LFREVDLSSYFLIINFVPNSLGSFSDLPTSISQNTSIFKIIIWVWHAPWYGWFTFKPYSKWSVIYPRS